VTRFSIRTVISRPPEIVDRALMIPGNSVYWNIGLKQFEVITGRPGEAGSVARLHYSGKGGDHILEDRLIESEPGRRYLSRVSGPAIEAEVETLLTPRGEKTELTLHWSGRGLRIPVRILLPLLRNSMARRAAAELETFRTLVETRGSDFSSAGPPPEA